MLTYTNKIIEIHKNVAVLLATYNGDKFLRQQLDSLFNQSFQQFSILIRDDGSTDNTLQIIEEYQHKYPQRITLILDNKQNLGVTQNFSALLEKSTADYLFFCDQDDIWFPNKIEISLRKIIELENQDYAMPCMVYSDMELINEKGEKMNTSVWETLNLHPKYFTLNRLLVQNIPHGCTIVINKALRNLAFPIPNQAILHDHWIALLIACYGKMAFIETPTMQLRNHPASVTRKPISFAQKIKNYIRNLFSKEEYNKMLFVRVNQAKALRMRTSSFVNYQQTELLKDFILLEKTSGIERKKILINHQFYRTTIWHTLKMLLRA